MAQAAAATGIPLAAWKRAKQDGCPAFRWNRVSLGPFLRWWFERSMEDAGRDWGRELKKAQAMREQIRLEEDAGNVLDRGAVQEAAQGLMSELFGALDRVFCSELPPILKGLDERNIRTKMKLEIEHMKARLRRRLEKLAGIKR